MREKVWMVVFVLVLGSAWTTALVGVDRWTAPKIREHELKKLRMSVLGALGIAYEEQDIEEVFLQNVETMEKNGKTVYKSKDGDVAFRVSGSGVQGPISGVVAMRPDLKTIKGITIVHQEETPGLGDRVLEDKTLDGFKGKSIDPRLRVLASGTAASDNEVQGISGATLTCNAFEKILNGQIREYVSLIAQ
jgi:Na(+)-translocating NADH:ubiquinone oxidoreductase C subunit